MTTVSPRQLEQALRACARGIRHHEAGASLLIDCGHWLHRDDFTSRFIEHGTSSGTPMAATDWEAAITAMHAGGLPASGGERRMLPGGQHRRRGPGQPLRHPGRHRPPQRKASSSALLPTPPDFKNKKRTNNT